jgi:hypothetical protein
MTFRSLGDDRSIELQPTEMDTPAARELLDTFNAMQQAT